MRADPLLDVAGAADYLAVSPAAVRKFIFEKRLAIVRIGRRVFLEASELERFIDAGREPAARTRPALHRIRA